MSSSKLTPAEKLKKVMIYLLAFYLLIMGGFYFFQEKIFFHPTPLPSDYQFHFKQKFVEKPIKPDASTVTDIVRFLPADSAKGVVLYFHGNRDNIERYAPYSEIFTRHGYECWMVDYPGFGKSTGRLTTESMQIQALQTYLLARSMFKPESIIVYGKSLGSGPASFLASTRPCSRLILETPYYSLSSLARHFAPIFPINWLIKIDFDNGEALQAVAVPITIFHGDDDHTIPLSNATKLKAVLKPKDEFIIIEGGHHNGIADFPKYHQMMDSILSLPNSSKGGVIEP